MRCRPVYREYFYMVRPRFWELAIEAAICVQILKGAFTLFSSTGTDMLQALAHGECITWEGRWVNIVILRMIY